MFGIVFLLVGCFPEFNEEKANTFVENPSDDYDNDSFTEDVGDCNDLNNNQNPDAEEICDGIDNDCNGLVDDNAVDIETWYLDADGDGFGDESTELVADAEDDTGLVSGDPIEIDVRDADFIVPDVQGAVQLDDIDQDGWSEFMLTHPTYSYAGYQGGVNAIFSACDN